MHPELPQADDRSYTIIRLPETSGMGWRLRVFVAGDEVGFREFLIRAVARDESLIWWDSLTDEERTASAQYATSAAEAYRHHLLDVAYAEAENTACAWMDAGHPTLQT